MGRKPKVVFFFVWFSQTKTECFGGGFSVHKKIIETGKPTRFFSVDFPPLSTTLHQQHVWKPRYVWTALGQQTGAHSTQKSSAAYSTHQQQQH